MPKHSARSAIRLLERSKIPRSKIQRELMGADLDLEKMVIYLKGRIQFDVADRVMDIGLVRSIDGASTIKVSLNDYDRSIVQSRRLHNALDVQLDGMWFRMVKVEREAGDDQLDLTFEQREIAVLRSYPKKGAKHNGVIFADRAKVTRAEFILRLIREVKEFKIPVVIPELHRPQAIEKGSDTPTWGSSADGSDTESTDYSGVQTSIATGGGVGTDHNRVSSDDRNESPQRVAANQLYVKGVPASKAQIANANTIVAVGQSMKVRRKLLVVSLMVATQESTLQNLAGGDRDSVGLFQQRASWGSYSDRHNPAAAARLFFKAAIPKDQFEPDMPAGKLASDIQRDYTWNTPRMGDDYERWHREADRFVTAFGVPGGADEWTAAEANSMGDNAWQSGSDYVYYRGEPKESDKVWKREDSWTCIRRLAEEVGWRAFFIGGVFYFLPDEDLFKTQPIMHIEEKTPGIIGIGFDLDVGKPTSEVKIKANVGKWLAPPGSVIVVKNTGPANGRWIVNEFERSIFGTEADITCTKPQAELPEPLDDSVEHTPTWAKVGVSDDPSRQPTAPDQPGWAGIDTDGSRNAVVKVAELALKTEQTNHYRYPPDEGGDGTRPARPIPDSLFGAEAHKSLDCSAFATLCYKEAGCEDPNGFGYNGTGNTGTLVKRGRSAAFPNPGDLIFYGGSLAFPGHVAVFVGAGKIIEIGSSNGILKLDWTYRPVVAIRSYLPL